MELLTKNRRQAAGIAAAVAAALLAVLALWMHWPAQTALRTVPVLPQRCDSTDLPEPSPYRAEDFLLQGQYMTCAAGEAVLAVDVSRLQGEIDWQQVKAAGVQAAILRVGGRGYGQAGTLYADTQALVNYTQAKAAGIAVGVYFFSQAQTPAEARQEARFVLSVIDGWELELPVVFDWENMGPGTRTELVDTQTLIRCTQAFCRTVTRAGYPAMVYFNPDQARDIRYLQRLQGYGFWLALYSQEMSFPYRVDMWQYTNQGSIPGITGPVDLNLLFIKE